MAITRNVISVPELWQDGMNRDGSTCEPSSPSRTGLEGRRGGGGARSIRSEGRITTKVYEWATAWSPIRDSTTPKKRGDGWRPVLGPEQRPTSVRSPRPPTFARRAAGVGPPKPTSPTIFVTRHDVNQKLGTCEWSAISETGKSTVFRVLVILAWVSSADKQWSAEGWVSHDTLFGRRYNIIWNA